MTTSSGVRQAYRVAALKREAVGQLDCSLVDGKHLPVQHGEEDRVLGQLAWGAVCAIDSISGVLPVCILAASRLKAPLDTCGDML